MAEGQNGRAPEPGTLHRQAESSREVEVPSVPAIIAKKRQRSKPDAQSENTPVKRKHRSGKNKYDVIRAGRGQGGRRSTAEDAVRHQLAMETYYQWRGVTKAHAPLSMAEAYFRTYPEKRKRMTAAVATRLAVREIAYAKEHGAEDDVLQAYKARGLDAVRLAAEHELRLRANTLKEVVKSEVIRPRSKKGKPGKRAYVLTQRETIEVEDNATRMRATELLADVHSARKTPAGGVQQNVGIIYVLGGKIMKKRQERLDV